MNRVLLVLIFITASATAYAQHSLTKLWSTDTVLQVPESVLFDAANNVLYVALIDGAPGAKDGKGGIAKVGTDGKITNQTWVTGLNAPKGMGKSGNTLYVADVSDVVAIDIATGKVTKKTPVAGAKFLNDLTVDANGVVYVSDSDTKKVHRMANGQVTTYLDNFAGPNGLLAVGNELLILDSGKLVKADAQKKLTTLAEGMEGGTDGIEEVKKGEYVVSCWGGRVYYVNADGGKQELLNTSTEKINSADIGYDAKKKIVYVPTFFRNGVVAYQLK